MDRSVAAEVRIPRLVGAASGQVAVLAGQLHHPDAAGPGRGPAHLLNLPIVSSLPRHLPLFLADHVLGPGLFRPEALH